MSEYPKSEPLLNSSECSKHHRRASIPHACFRYGGCIGEAGGRALGLSLPVLHSLTHISIPHQRIGAHGASAIAQGLTLNTSVSYLDIRSNIICDEGAISIAEMLVWDRFFPQFGSHFVRSSFKTSLSKACVSMRIELETKVLPQSERPLPSTADWLTSP